MATSLIKKEGIVLYGYVDITDSFVGSPKQYTAPTDCIVRVVSPASSSGLGYLNMWINDTEVNTTAGTNQSAELVIALRKNDVLRFNATFPWGAGGYKAYLF